MRHDNRQNMSLETGLVKVVQEQCVFLYLSKRLQRGFGSLALKNNDATPSQKHNIDPTLLPGDTELKQQRPTGSRRNIITDLAECRTKRC